MRSIEYFIKCVQPFDYIYRIGFLFRFLDVFDVSSVGIIMLNRSSIPPEILCDAIEMIGLYPVDDVVPLHLYIEFNLSISIFENPSR